MYFCVFNSNSALSFSLAPHVICCACHYFFLLLNCYFQNFFIPFLYYHLSSFVGGGWKIKWQKGKFISKQDIFILTNLMLFVLCRCTNQVRCLLYLPIRLRSQKNALLVLVVAYILPCKNQLPFFGKHSKVTE